MVEARLAKPLERELILYKMKKVFLLAGCLSLLAIGIFTVSCKKDEKEWKGCTCTAVEGTYRYTFTVTAAEAREFGAENCGTVRAYTLLADPDLDSVTCTDL